MIKNPKEENVLIRIHKGNIREQHEEKVSRVIEELLDLLSKYKAKRNLWEFKLKTNDDPREHEFYAIIARLTMIDMMVMDLEHINWLLKETTDVAERDAEVDYPVLHV